MSLITKQSSADAVNNNVRSKVTWSYDYNNLPPVWSGYSSGITRNYFDYAPKVMNDNEIGGDLVIATAFVDSVRNWIYNELSRIRNVRVIHRNTGENTNINGDSTYVCATDPQFRQAVTLSNAELGCNTGSPIDDNINWAAAYNAWTRVRGNIAFTVTNTIHAQHSSHSSHGSHGSRVRR